METRRSVWSRLPCTRVLPQEPPTAKWAQARLGEERGRLAAEALEGLKSLLHVWLRHCGAVRLEMGWKREREIIYQS